ncbi:F-box domain protein [Rhizophagus clarus]|uniref:F-box domain protein n=1 Tax=Rhizophagus clarus TaxID=94130 RepID=A0A8H3M3J1_9GLOM|nr:F-box domain protein [Rhizophagus clarus]
MDEYKINIVSIPREILIEILSWLNPKSLSNLSKTCKFFHKFCKFDSFWLNMCKKFGIDKLGNFPNFYTMYTGILYKYGWLIGYWAGNKSMLFCIQYDSNQHKAKIMRSNLLYDEEDNKDEEFIIREAIFEKHHESELWKQEREEGNYYENIIEQKNCFSFENEKFFKIWTLKNNQTENKSFDGIWVGNYGNHGIEFLLLKYEISDYLTATKITGDINVPRGEISWRCNLKDQVRICDEKEWNGKISYRAKAKVAYTGFRNPKEIDSEVIVVSNDKLVVYWYDLGEMTTFVRVV